MRTTLNLPDALVARAKARAAASGRTLTSLIEEGLRLALEHAERPDRAAVEPLPAYGERGGRILVDLTDRNEVRATMDEDRRT